MAVRTGEAQWKGSLREGQGTMKLGSGAFEGRYSVASRFEGEPGTNPEELIGAALAGCFSMALAANLARANKAATSIHTTARVHLERVGDGFKITRIELENDSQVPGLDATEFAQIADETKRTCPVSQALAGTTITLRAALQS